MHSVGFSPAFTRPEKPASPRFGQEDDAPKLICKMIPLAFKGQRNTLEYQTAAAELRASIGRLDERQLDMLQVFSKPFVYAIRHSALEKHYRAVDPENVIDSLLKE
ncbi:MAG: hypothetical protein IPK79_10480 [Vampirovibrionales bacterium]|nr:hypothetical protein [Vampirovibrionales bacterium]